MAVLLSLDGSVFPLPLVEQMILGLLTLSGCAYLIIAITIIFPHHLRATSGWSQGLEIALLSLWTLFSASSGAPPTLGYRCLQAGLSSFLPLVSCGEWLLTPQVTRVRRPER